MLLHNLSAILNYVNSGQWWTVRILITACSNRQKYSILIFQHLEQNSWLAVVMWFVLTIKV